MNILSILKPAYNIPEITFNIQTSTLVISGNSFPESAEVVFKPVSDWFALYVLNPMPVTTVVFSLEYFNTPSSLYFLDILFRLKKLNETNQVFVKWYLSENDEVLLEAGETYREIVNIPFEIIEMQNMPYKNVSEIVAP